MRILTRRLHILHIMPLCQKVKGAIHHVFYFFFFFVCLFAECVIMLLFFCCFFVVVFFFFFFFFEKSNPLTRKRGHQRCNRAVSAWQFSLRKSQ